VVPGDTDTISPNSRALDIFRIKYEKCALIAERFFCSEVIFPHKRLQTEMAIRRLMTGLEV